MPLDANVNRSMSLILLQYCYFHTAVYIVDKLHTHSIISVVLCIIVILCGDHITHIYIYIGDHTT